MLQLQHACSSVKPSIVSLNFLLALIVLDTATLVNMYTWNTTIEDTSPLLIFSPYSDSAASGGWAPYFAQAGYFNGQGGEDSKGQDSVHVTSFPGATVLLQFEGSAIYLYGQTNCSYTVTLDSQPVDIPSSLPQGMLFFDENLSATAHFVELTAEPQAGSAQLLQFDKAVFTNIGANSTNDLTPVKYDTQNQAVVYSGKWNSQTAYNVPSPYMETSDPQASASLNFTGAYAVAINSMRDWGHWNYSVTLDGTTSAYNASTWWLMPDTMLFYKSNLDPTKNYTIDLVNSVSQTYYKMDLGYFTLFSANGNNTGSVSSSSSVLSPSSSSSTLSGPSQPADAATTSTKKINIGVIVGPIVAVVAVIGIIIALLWWRRHRISEDNGPPKSDSLEPYVADRYPQNERPDLWYKGMGGDPTPEMSHTVVPPVVPYSGKRRIVPDPAVSNNPGPSAPAVPPPTAEVVTFSSASVPPVSAQPSSRYTHSVEPPSSPGTRQTIDVNQIIELIAQRIDPAVRSTPLPTTADGSVVPPPRYPA